MNGIKLLGMGRAVPDQIMTNEMFAQRVDTSDAWITSRTGIRERRYCVDETHTQLCCAAPAGPWRLLACRRRRWGPSSWLR